MRSRSSYSVNPPKVIVSRSHSGKVSTFIQEAFGNTTVIPAGGAGKERAQVSVDGFMEFSRYLQHPKNATTHLLLIYSLHCVGSDVYRIKRITLVLTVEH